jgi:hypothetical protein
MRSDSSITSSRRCDGWRRLQGSYRGVSGGSSTMSSRIRAASHDDVFEKRVKSLRVTSGLDSKAHVEQVSSIATQRLLRRVGSVSAAEPAPSMIRSDSIWCSIRSSTPHWRRFGRHWWRRPRSAPLAVRTSVCCAPNGWVRVTNHTTCHSIAFARQNFYLF